MFTVTQNKIFLTRGDNADINIILNKETGQRYTLQADDRVVFRVKKQVSPYPSAVLIEKEAYIQNGEISISFLPEDTISFDFGKYHYEVELITAGGEHYTVIADSVFEIGTELENHGR